MQIKRPWAFWRRTQYILSLLFAFVLIGTGVYFGYFYDPATCFDGVQNGDERGIDCGGDCVRVCALDTLPPTVLWSRSFKVTEGQYNAVAYVKNANLSVGAPEVRYTFKLYDSAGLITEREGVTILPPDSVYPIFEGRLYTGTRVPTQTTIELEGADVWLPATAGREQFFVASRELVDTESSPRLTAEIENTALTEALDVEIVATIFDARGNALTASQTFVPIFAPRTTERVVFTWPEPIAKTIRSCDMPTDVVLAVDVSGSMNNDNANPPEPISSVLTAARAFVDRLNDHDQVGVVTYATDAKTVQTLSGNKTSVASLVAGLAIDPKEETGSTNTGDALIRAREELASARHNAEARSVVVLLSDGLANAPGDDPEVYAQNAGKALKDIGADVFVIGLGSQVNEPFLQSLATSPDHYFKAPTRDTVDRIYRSITAAICEDGAAVIEIVPKTDASFTPVR